MAESYLYDIIISRHSYLHPNGVTITTGLWAINDFLPQVHIFLNDFDLFFTIEEWQTIYKEIKSVGQYTINNNIHQYLLYRLIFCDKRCPTNIIHLVFESLNTFACCIDLRLMYIQKCYNEAIKFVNKMNTVCNVSHFSSVEDIQLLLKYHSCTYSLIEQEISALASIYFVRYLFKSSIKY